MACDPIEFLPSLIDFGSQYEIPSPPPKLSRREAAATVRQDWAESDLYQKVVL